MGDRFDEGVSESSIAGSTLVVGGPMPMHLYDWRPRACCPTQLYRFGRPGIEQRNTGCTHISGRSGDIRFEQGSQKNEVHKIPWPVVDSLRRVVRIRAGMELLGDLEAQGDTDERVGVRKPKMG